MLWEIVFLINKYKDFFGDEGDGEQILKNELSSIIETKERKHLFLKKCTYFYNVVKKCKKDTWKSCKIPPSYWRDLTNETWGSISNLIEEI